MIIILDEQTVKRLKKYRLFKGDMFIYQDSSSQ